LAALEGVICFGPNRGREPTYVLLADWIASGSVLPPEKALAELAYRHLSAYAPATPEDFAVWSGLSLTEARAAWQQMGYNDFFEEERCDPYKTSVLRLRAAGFELF
jgi:hypothetical protein